MWNWFETRWRVEGGGPPGGVGRARGAWRKLLGGQRGNEGKCYWKLEGRGSLLLHGGRFRSPVASRKSETPLMNAKENFRKNIRSAAQFLLMAYSKK